MMKKMNKKGFTLIELLAIIVILAIIAVITVPIILNIIENAREGARKNSVIGYGKAVELAYTQALYEKELNGTTTLGGTTGDDVIIGGTTRKLDVNYEGDDVVCTSVEIGTDGKLTMDGCRVNSGNESYKYTAGSVEKNAN